jgi:anti-sigma regulatory factor (Ser/Thr protein kinase)
VQLPDDDHAMRTARRFARTWAEQQHLASVVADNLQLVLSELVGNAIRHGAPPYEIDLSQSDGVIHGNVSDGSLLVPQPNDSPDERGGFGLGIVGACTSFWGTDSTPTGKQVWFELKA